MLTYNTHIIKCLHLSFQWPPFPIRSFQEIFRDWRRNICRGSSPVLEPTHYASHLWFADIQLPKYSSSHGISQMVILNTHRYRDGSTCWFPIECSCLKLWHDTCAEFYFLVEYSWSKNPYIILTAKVRTMRCTTVKNCPQVRSIKQMAYLKFIYFFLFADDNIFYGHLMYDWLVHKAFRLVYSN